MAFVAPSPMSIPPQHRLFFAFARAHLVAVLAWLVLLVVVAAYGGEPPAPVLKSVVFTCRARAEKACHAVLGELGCIERYVQRCEATRRHEPRPWPPPTVQPPEPMMTP